VTDRSSTIRQLHDSGQWQALSVPERSALILEEMQDILLTRMRLEHLEAFPHITFTALGLDSLDAFDLESAWEERTGLTFPAALLLSQQSLQEISTQVATEDLTLPAAGKPAGLKI
jgi:acyl carrier protein